MVLTDPKGVRLERMFRFPENEEEEEEERDGERAGLARPLVF